MAVTEYRTINDGYWDFLQYKIIKKNFWGKEKENWVHVPDARFDSINYLKNFFDFDRLVCSLNHNLVSWVKKYPDVNIWLQKRTELIEEHKIKRDSKNQERENKKGQIKYL